MLPIGNSVRVGIFLKYMTLNDFKGSTICVEGRGARNLAEKGIAQIGQYLRALSFER